MGLSVKNASAGVDIAGKTFFNAAKVAAQTYKASVTNAPLQPRSATSGVMFAGSAAYALSRSAMKNRHSSVYWLTQKQATFLGVVIKDGETPTEITMEDHSVRLFNASQTNNKDAIEARFKKAETV